MGSTMTPPGPPPAGHDLAAEAADVERQMRARRKRRSVQEGWQMSAPRDGLQWSPADAEIAFAGPASVVGRVTVCVWHHLRGIHAGLVHASGTAPAAVRWELGLRVGQPPLLSPVGETYVNEETHVRVDCGTRTAQGAKGRAAA
jgi:hypothetical protein